MANLNKVMLIGRLTRDVETRTFSNGGKVAQFGFAVTGSRKKNQQTGKWEDEPCFLDVKVFNRGEFGRSADLAEQYLSKGRQVFIEGHLRMESWTSQDGQKRNKIVVEVDKFEFLDSRDGGSTLQLGQAIHVKEMTLPEGIKPLSDPDEVVVAVVTQHVPVLEPTTPIEGGPAEPEVITARKPTEEEGEAESKKK